MGAAQRHHPRGASGPNTPGLLAMDPLQVVKPSPGLFSIIVLAQVAFPCQVQGILVPNPRNPSPRFRESCSQSPQWLDTSPSHVPGAGDTQKHEVRDFGGHSPTLLAEEVVSRVTGGLGDHYSQSKAVTLQDRNVTDTFHSPPTQWHSDTRDHPTTALIADAAQGLEQSRHVLLPAFQLQAVPREPGFASWGTLSQGCGSAGANPGSLCCWFQGWLGCFCSPFGGSFVQSTNKNV